jgi:hypothetical protein
MVDSFNKKREDRFNKKLVAVSESEDLNEAKKEWEFFVEEKSDEYKICICSTRIKIIKYFFNKINGNIICCGTTCCTKFNSDITEMSNKTLEKIFKLKSPYNEYKQFTNIEEYLDYAKDELESFMITEINNSNFNNLIILLENIININQNYGLTVFDSYIETIKIKIIELTPSYIEDELNKDFEIIIELMKKFGKFGKLYVDYQIKKPDIKVFEDCINKIVEHNIRNYSEYTTPHLQSKFDKVIEILEKFKHQTHKESLINDFLIESNNKLKAKIQRIRYYNFQYEKSVKRQRLY